MGGTGDWVVTVVRAQIKLSLAINEQRGEEEEGKTPNDGTNLRRELSNIYTNQSNGWHRGGRRSLMRTHRLIKPKLDAEMGRIWEYDNYLKAFGQIFGETVAKIEQIGAFVLYLYLYKSLLNQHLFGWTEKAKKAIPILYESEKGEKRVEGTVDEGQGKAERNGQNWEGKNGQINGQSLGQNANRAIVVNEKKPNWKKAENYLLRIGKKLEGKLHKKMPSLSQTDGTIGRSQRMTTTTTSAFPQGKMGEMPPNWHEIEKAIKLNEEVTIILA
ncbi:hypothetical protein niasHT_000945 [Heterodera trifolii]|uniref:Uncharacterized protein n=1 Tax=Heterodera trifolii TaxID=157864 RepID=A0ABD2MCV7_9BILA